jgi:hypothetical protein
MKEGRIGTLGSDGALLERLKERLPRKVWTFVTPKGKKDRLQLMGSFLITESKPVSFVPKWKYNLFYDAASPRSVLPHCNACITPCRRLARRFAPVGNGVSELRIHYGPGYRVYLQQRGTILVVLLCGGDKSTQARDIVLAKKLAQEWKE